MKTNSSLWVRRRRRRTAVPALLSLAMAVSAAVPAFGQNRLDTIVENFLNTNEAVPWDQITGSFDTARGWGELRDSIPPLNAADSAAEPDLSPAGMPQVPLSCPIEPEPVNTPRQPDAARDGCEPCFREAIRKLDFNRRIFERLRAIGSSTITMTKKAIAFGDSSSGIHAVVGLEWSTAVKPKIEQSQREFKSAYSAKYRELMHSLEANLRDLGRCEERYFNNRDWYARQGYMLYSFMEHRYSPDLVINID